MKKTKIQNYVNEKAINILNKLHRYDKGRFLEQAIISAYDNQKIYKNFNWLESEGFNNRETVEEQGSVEADNTPPVKKVKIDNRW